MYFNNYQDMKQAEAALESRGFRDEFIFDGRQLRNVDTQVAYATTDLAIVEYHRFTDSSDPEDRTMVFALETKDEIKGKIRLNYAADEELKLISFLDKIRIKPHPSSN